MNRIADRQAEKNLIDGKLTSTRDIRLKVKKNSPQTGTSPIKFDDEGLEVEEAKDYHPNIKNYETII